MRSFIKIGTFIGLLLIIICCSNTTAENWMTIDSAVVQQADTITLSIEIDNDDPFVAFQCDVLLPESMIYIENSAMLTERSDDHIISATVLEGNCLRIIVFSPNNNFFLGNEGDVLTFEINTGNVLGWFPLNLENVIIANENSQNICTGVINGWIDVQFLTGYNDEKFKEQFAITIFPNPFTSVFKLEILMSESGYVKYIIMDLQGRIIYQESGKKLLSPGKHYIQFEDMHFAKMVYQKGTYLFQAVIRTENEIENIYKLITKI
jgi:hypothetical protein